MVVSALKSVQQEIAVRQGTLIANHLCIQSFINIFPQNKNVVNECTSVAFVVAKKYVYKKSFTKTTYTKLFNWGIAW